MSITRPKSARALVYVACLCAALLFACACAVPAHAVTVTDSTYGTLDSTKLANGTYTVDVSAQTLSLGKSMASGAIDGTDELVVKDGVYTLNVKLDSVTVGSLTGKMGKVAFYPNYSVSGTTITPSGTSTQVWSTDQVGGATGTAKVPVQENAHSFAKSKGYIPVNLYIPIMKDLGGTGYADAVFVIDWKTLKVKSLDSSDSTSSSEDKTGDTPGDATNGSGNSSGSSTSGTGTNNTRTSNNTGTSSGTSGTSSTNTISPSTATSGTSKTTNTNTTVSASSGALESGHVYSVPMSFAKANSSEVSMANQYFGSAAIVRPLANGTFDVRFSTNRPDYIVDLQYNGASAEVTNETANSREYRIVVPNASGAATYPITLTIKPMQDLGAGPVTADLHLNYAQAADQGGDSGQVASSIPDGAVPVAAAAGSSATGTGTAAATQSSATPSSRVAGMPTTGDPYSVSTWAMLAAFGLFAAVVSRRKGWE